ncbi:hypothetical protein QQS21_008457 [Conoideocrella luteorostrata]|uniref:NACHT domain-containing protein n=1 Tax=Conoideocrella luteorostrata TaxID=1105319 RepID=A0AAJ0CLL2_9HYPO|nr:hypothetical protein QQS21_008457 [Conoideocrella luteorostrata]
MASRNCLDSPDSYAIAWITAFPIERAAAEAMLDEEHAAPSGFTRNETDTNVYTWGRVGEHNIVIVSPAGVYRITSAATIALGLLASHPSIRFGLLVGIGGGIPQLDDDRDIRLGDIVVSQPDGATGGVCQYAPQVDHCSDLHHETSNRASSSLHETDTHGESGSRHKVVSTLIAIAGALGSATHDSFDLTKFRDGAALDFPEIPGEKERNRNLAHIKDIYSKQLEEDDRTKAWSSDRHERKGFLGRPPTVLLNALTSIQADHELNDSKVPCFLQQMLEKNPKMGKRSKQNLGYAHQGFENDRLFTASSSHVPGPDCRDCDAAGEVQRDPRGTTDPDIHYGTIASGNTLVKDAASRDRIVADIGEDCICFDTEAAGLMNHFPCLIIRGICDYADSHMNDRWQRYASATAAAYAKELLAYVPVVETQETKRALEVLQLVRQQVQQPIDGAQQTAATKAVPDSISSGLLADTIKRWLCPPDPSTNASRARELRHEGTGVWLLKNSVFQEWHSGARQHLWLHGLAGCGKTVLSATVMDYLAKGNNCLILSFFFDISDITKQTLYSMLRSFVFQLYQGGAGYKGLLNGLFQAHQYGRHQPATKALSDVLFEMLAIQKKKVSIVLDALDESTTRGELLLWIKDVVSRPELRHVQLICTGRPEAEFLRDIPSWIGDKNDLALDKQAINADVRSYVTAQLSQRPEFQNKGLSQDLLEQIRSKIEDGTDGMFKWAACQLDSLARCPSPKAIQTALNQLPQDLKEMYRRMMKCIPTELKTDAIRLLQFLVHSKRPLRPAEAKEVIATQIENGSRGFSIKRRPLRDTDVLAYCPSLVKIVHTTDKELHLAHFSVKQYLLSENQFNITTASISITSTCLTYLTDINGSHEEITQGFPMARYAAEVWTGYAALAQASEDIVRAAVRFLEEEATFQRWARLYQPDKDCDPSPDPPRGSRLYYACFAGLVAPARDLIARGADVNAQGGTHGSALQAAARQGHQEIVTLLLDKGADVNAQGGKYGNALQAAAGAGYQEIVTLLLDKGADVNAQVGKLGSALQAAARGGYQEIVTLLSDKGADVNAQGGAYGSALQAAARQGHQETVTLLLDKGADVNAQGGAYGNALQAAARQGYQEIVTMLLVKGADVNAQGGAYGNALQAAARGGHQEIITLLLNEGADVNAQGGNYGNALQAAAGGGHQEIVTLLLDKGADVNAQGEQTPLSWAAENGHEATVKLLPAAEGVDDAPQETRPVQAAPLRDSGYASLFAMEIKLNSLRKHGDQVAAEPVQEMAEQDVDDTATEYSNISSTTSSQMQQYIGELLGDLFSKISWLKIDEKTQREVLAILPELLQAFALKLGRDAPTQMHRDVMAFVHKHRHDIAEAIEDIGFKGDEEDLEKSTAALDGMTLQDRMTLWEDKDSYEEVSAEERICLSPDDIDTDESEIGSSSPDLEARDDESEIRSKSTDREARVVGIEDEVPDSWLPADREFISSTDAYEWLLTRLQRELRLVSAEPNTIQAIRGTIMSSLPTAHRISRKVSSQSYSARFELDWDILEFFQTQRYSTPPDQAFEGVVTLTGSCHDAQAATCAQYTRQTWPLTGEAMIQLVKEILRGGEGHSHLCKIRDGTSLTAWTSGSKFMVEADGVAISLAETVEQLAWLGAALRTSPRQSGLVYYTPIITNILQNSAQPQKSSTDITYEIGFIMEEVPKPPSNANGQCWHDIFRNPVIVKGYPIPQRSEWETGLEISLNILAGLARTQRVDRFKEKVYIKGFSTMLVPTKRNEDILCWHLIYKKDGSRISYLDDSVDQEQHFGSLDLENFRHVLGWCSEAKFYAGSAQAHHPNTYSRLPKPHEGCALAKTRVSAGRMIMGGPAFTIGDKDTPVQVSRNGYVPRLEWISTKFVLLWDEDDKRGWLINGTSALLHALRASLEYGSKGRFRSALLCKSEDLEESPTPFTADSAVDVLINPKNRNLKLYHEGDGYLLLESLIERFYNVLEKLIDHQIDIVGEGGRNLIDKPRRYLEGWDFEDLAKKQDPLYPCVATLNAAGKGWVDFTRAIHAVTLIGRGFGDMIRPAGANFCEYWAELPKRQYYIASCLSDLAEVMREQVVCGDNHVRLSDNLIWHTPTTVLTSCQCKGALGGDHCDPVQTLFPLPLSTRLLPRKHPIQREANGAFIFGYSSCFSWVWGDTGHPREGKLNEGAPSSNAVEMDTDSLNDSGIGTSLARSESEGRLLSPSRSTTRHLMRAPSESHNGTMTPNSSAFVKQKRYSRHQYKVGIICALPKELMAVRALFDDDHDSPGALPFDTNQYSLGVMEQHWIVAACLPYGEYGTNSAASVATNMSRSFTCIQFCLLVGIGGGAPSEKNDIRLGDVVVSRPTGNWSGVIQHDLGKEKEGRPFERTGSLRPPPRVLNTAVSSLCSDPTLPPDPLAPHLGVISARLEGFPKYKRPEKPDVLFQAACASCQARQVSQEECPHLRQRVPRLTAAPVIHYGLIASGNCVVKDAAIRDRLAEGGVLCIEMEAAGVLNTVDGLVIRGICDYCDAQKNDDWQEYAAAAAAAYAKLLLRFVTKEEGIRSRKRKRR